MTKSETRSQNLEGFGMFYSLLVLWVFPTNFDGFWMYFCSFMALFATLISYVGILAPHYGQRLGIAVPTENAVAYDKYEKEIIELKNEVHRLRTHVWNKEGSSSSILKNTEFQYII